MSSRRPMQAPRERHVARALLRWLLRIVGYGAIFAVGTWFGLVTAATAQLDELERRASLRQVPGAILARDGTTVLRRLRAPESRTYLEEGQVPELLANAVVAAEDRRFFTHSGIDLRGIARALVADVRARAAVEGGSTITQQLVKNTYVGPERTIARKSREAIFAVALETRWSKDRILVTYLNTAYFGSGHYGVVDAARGYFGLPVARLRPAQAALLASLLRAPEGNNPASAPARARAGRDQVIDAMRQLGTLDAAQARVAQSTPLPRPTQRRGGGSGELAPQLADAVQGTIVQRYGVRRALGAGMRVRTTIDAGMQRAARDAVARAGELGLDAALVAIEPRSGEVRAMANGGRAAGSAFNVALHGQRQPGSAFKPFMLAAAYEAGYAPGTAVLSAPFDKEYPGGQRFRVTNGGGYAGVTTLERATWQSDNTVYARLQDQLGIESAIEVARAAGIRSRMDPVPALVLGALPRGTTPTELAHAYATFAAHGERTAMVEGGAPRIINHVRLRSGETWRPTASRSRTLPRGVADTVTATLRGVLTRGTGTAAAIGRPAAGKTGTTEAYRDAWFVGYTPELVTAVWVGHAEGGIPMKTENGGAPVTGGSVPARIWREFMQTALAGVPVAEFELEQPRYVTVTIDPASGLLAGPWCVGAVTATFIEGKEPTETSPTCTERERDLPDMRGIEAEAAREQLADDGFERVRVSEELVASENQHGLVVRQEPEPGDRVRRGDVIVLYVGDHPFSD